jgi:hypothetical protein
MAQPTIRSGDVRQLPPPLKGRGLSPFNKPEADQTQPGALSPIGLRYRRVLQFTPAGALPACRSVIRELNRHTRSKPVLSGSAAR